MTEVIPIDVPGPELTEVEARALVERIRKSAERTWELLIELHDRKGWKALGYPSFKSCVGAEFRMSRSRAYQLVDQGTVVKALREAAGVYLGGQVNERQARAIKPHLAEAVARIEAGETVDAVVSDLRNPPAPTPSPEAEDLMTSPSGTDEGASEGAPILDDEAKDRLEKAAREDFEAEQSYDEVILTDDEIRAQRAMGCASCADLRAALARYGRHDDRCQPGRCSCGWSAVSARLNVPV